MEAIFLPRAVARRLRERGSGLMPEELVIEALAELDPDEKAEAYWEVAEHYLARAEEELARGELREASEKVWGAAALAIKAHTLAREGKRLTSHGGLWEHKENVAAELGEWVRDVWAHATSMHVNFYEGWATEADVREALRQVERLVRAVRTAIQPPGTHKP